MTKNEAIELLGGTPGAVAKEVGVQPQAIYGWPEVLTRKLEDRVLAALWRRQQTVARIIPAVAPTREAV